MRLLFIVCTLSLLPCSSVLPRSSVEESPAVFGAAVPVAVVDGFGGGFRHRLQRVTTHGGEIVPNFGTIPGRRLRHSVQLVRHRRGCRAAIVSIFGTIYLQAAKVGRCRRCR